MKAPLKAVFFLVTLFVLELGLRGGYFPFPIPFQLPLNGVILLLFLVFTVLAWALTKWFCRSDRMTLKDLGISFGANNRSDFLIGFLVGITLWGIVSVVQSWTAGFSWTLRPDANYIKVFYGLIFIFIADLGTELFYRGYALTKFQESFGAKAAIVIMVFFVGLKSYSFNLQGELLLYALLIPALHTIFFSIIYFKTKRLGAAVGVHTGANFITISIFDLRAENPSQAIPAGIFGPDASVETLSLTAIQMPWVIMAILFSIVVYFWWVNPSIQEYS